MRNPNSEKEDRTAELMNELIRTHGPHLQNVITNIVRDAGIAQQILQDTYERLFKRLTKGSGKPIADVKAYLFGAASKNALEYKRGERRREKSGTEIVVDDEAARHVYDRAPGPEKEAALEDVIQQLSDLVDRLPKKQRRVFVLGKVEGVSRRAIAAQLGISEDSVENLMTRALATLRARLVERGIESSLSLDDPVGP